MLTFREHVQPLRATDFPTLAKFDQRGNLPMYIERINAALASGSIPNADYKGLKDAISYWMEKAQSTPEDIMVAAVRHESKPGVRGFTLSDFYYGSAYPNQIAGKLKKAEKAKPVSDEDRIFMAWYLPVMRELLPMGEAIVALKDLAVKKMPKSAEEKAAAKQAFIAPMVSSEVGRQVRDSLQALTDEFKADYQNAIFVMLTDLARDYARMSKDELRDMSHGQRMRFQIVLGTRAAWKDGKLTTDAPKAFNAQAKTIADDMQASFVYKNSAKLQSILLAKNVGLTHDPKVLNSRSHHGVFEGDIRIDFGDSSGFTVRNKVVWKQSVNGLVFNQFPTTFHDVRMPDGKPMSAPSEERMNSVFTAQN